MPEIPTSSAELEPQAYFRQSWFKAYMDGNNLMPVRFQGIALMLTRALYKDKPENWQEFLRAVFSDTQLKTLAKIRAYVHKVHKIPETQDVASTMEMPNIQLKSVKEVMVENLSLLAGVPERQFDFMNFVETPNGQVIGQILDAVVDKLTRNQNVLNEIKIQHTLLGGGKHERSLQTLVPQAREDLRSWLAEALREDETYIQNKELADKILEIFI